MISEIDMDKFAEQSAVEWKDSKTVSLNDDRYIKFVNGLSERVKASNLSEDDKLTVTSMVNSFVSRQMLSLMKSTRG